MKHFLIYFVLYCFSCISPSKNEQINEARVDIRFDTKFYSILLSKNNKAYVIKGSGTDYRDSLVILNSDTSLRFKIDSVKTFFIKLDSLRLLKPIGVDQLDAPRIEIYYYKEKIFDTYRWDENFFNLIRPIMTQLPSGFNPFRVDELPFG